MTLERYYQMAWNVRDSVESLTAERWKDLPRAAIKQALTHWDPGNLENLPGLDFLLYLRHHGFPSPILDWTNSPYVAAFFAFSRLEKGAEHVAIFAHIEFDGRGRVEKIGKPTVKCLRRSVQTHSRHFRQQGVYTVCLSKASDSAPWDIGKYDDVPHELGGQGSWWKFELPISERESALSELDAYNLNAYALMGSEEALMETLAFRQHKNLTAEAKFYAAADAATRKKG